MPSACPNRDELSGFLLGTIPEASAAAIVTHLAECPQCEETVETLEAQVDTAILKLRRPRVTDSFSQEEACRQAIELVEQFGKSVSAASSVGSDNAAAGVGEQEQLGTIRVYELLAKIGEGGMGAVYKARHTELDKIVALKVLPAQKLKDADAVQRFKREMKAVGRLDHQHIVRAMDAGEENGMHYLVMEYVPGVDLAELVRRVGPLLIADACELMRQAALGLQEASDNGLVHRDIKPSNLMLASAGNKPPLVKILDMGLALFDTARHERELTSAGQVMGTIDYMAPEQGGDSHLVDIRADLYSLGATLYKLLAGESPFGGPEYDKPMKKLAGVLRDVPRPLSSRRRDVPAALSALVASLLAKDPRERLKTPQELADRLQPFCQGANLQKLLARANQAAEEAAVLSPSEVLSKQGTHPSYSSPIGDTAVTVDLPQHPAPAGAKRKLPWLAILAGCGGLAAIALGIILYLQTPDGLVKIEINDPAIKVMVDNDGANILPGGKEHAIKLIPGKHGLTITRGDFKFETTNFEFKKGQKVVICVTYQPGSLKVTQNDTTILEQKEPVDDRQPTGYALEFDGATSYVTLPQVEYDWKKPVTYEAWVTLGPMPKGNRGRMVWSHDGSFFSAASYGWQFYHYSAGAIHPQVEEGRREHIVAQWDGENCQAFINGIPTSNISPLKPEKSPPAGRGFLPRVIGAYGKLGGEPFKEHFAGRIDEIRVSDVARYPEKFTPPNPDEPFAKDEHTLMLYHFDEGTGNELKDSSGNNHHGIIVSAQWVSAGVDAVPFPRGLEMNASTVVAKGVKWDGGENYTLELWCTPKSEKYGELIVCLGQFGLYYEQDPNGTTFWKSVAHSSETGKPVYQGTWSRPGAFQVNRLQHVAAVRSAEGLRIFVGGQPCSGNLPVGSLDKVMQEILLGRRFEGTLHAVRISKSARYTNVFQPEQDWKPDADTFALYRCDEGAGDVLHDASGHGFDCNIQRAKWVDGPPTTTRLGGPFALEFDGVDDRVELPELPFGSEDKITVEAIVEVSERKTEPSSVASIRGAGLRFVGNRLGFGGAFPGGQPSPWAMGDYVPTPGKRVYLAGVWDRERCFLFVDGRRLAVNKAEMMSLKLNHFSFLGAGAMANQSPFKGRLLAIRVSRTARYVDDYQPQLPFEADPDTVALYKFEEGTGDVLKDSTANKFDGKIVGAKWVRFESGPDVPSPSELVVDPVPKPVSPDYALRLDAADQAIETRNVKLPSAGPWTVEGWVTPREPVSSGHGVALLFMIDPVWVAARHDKGGIFYTAGGPVLGGGPARVSDTKAVAGDRVHVALTRVPKGVQFFCNGVPHGEPLAIAFSPGQAQFRVRPPANDMWSHVLFNGDFDEVRVSSTIRYQEKFDPQPRFEPDADTVALYHCDEGTGDVLKDSSRNKFDGKLVDAKWVRVDKPIDTPPVAVESMPAAPGDYALHVSGDDYLDTSDVILPTKEWTVEGWLTPREVLPSGKQAALVFSVDPAWLSLRPGAGNEVKWAVGGPTLGPAPTLFSEGRTKLGTRVHLCFTRFGGRVYFFMDGKQQGESMPIAFFKPDTALRMRPAGNPQRGDALFNGDFDEVRVSSMARYKENFDPQPRFEPDADTIALFHFDEGKDAILKDASSNKKHGKLTGGKWVTADGSQVPLNGAIEFDGIDDCITTPFMLSDSGLYEPDRAFTYEAWVMPEEQTEVGWGPNAKPSELPGLMGFYTETNVQLMSIRRWSLHGKVFPDEPRYGKWQHLAAVWDGKVYRLFVDGKPAPDIVPTWKPGPDTRFSFGGWWVGDRSCNCFRGTVDEVRLSSIARYAEEFQPERTFKPDAETEALYHCDEAAGDRLKDASSHGRDATLIGAKRVKVETPPMGR